MYAVFDPITATVIYTGTFEQCTIFLDTRSRYKRYCRLVPVVEVDGEPEPYTVEDTEVKPYDEDTN